MLVSPKDIDNTKMIKLIGVIENKLSNLERPVKARAGIEAVQMHSIAKNDYEIERLIRLIPEGYQTIWHAILDEVQRVLDESEIDYEEINDSPIKFNETSLNDLLKESMTSTATNIISASCSFNGNNNSKILFKKNEKSFNNGHELDLVNYAIDVCNSLKIFWNETAYPHICDDINPFILPNGRVVVLGSGELLIKCLSSAFTYQPSCRFYLLDGLPNLPHELNQKTQGKRLFSRIMKNLGVKGKKETSLNRTFIHVRDAQASSALQGANFVLMSAYCITQNGGIVHRAGSFQLALLAKSLGIPLYVVCESFKYRKIYPLHNNAIIQPTSEDPLCPLSPLSASSSKNFPTLNSLCLEDNSLFPYLEFVPGDLITFFFTDKGIMPPVGIISNMNIK